MRLSRLEITGFKSFADSTVFDFDKTITGIVGPNGCGKSNIVDALRWVMGEQSAKHLRGNAMDDVIFTGSDTRPAAGFAEVTVCLSPENGGFPGDFAHYGEVALTRRLHKDGTSEYFINRTPSRLRDITEFFLGTGLGAKAYSIIEQGQVGQVINAKPEDRRYIIEEVAGISKYRSRKMEALRKLEATQLDIERVTDIVKEVKRQMNSLNRQAKAAERYKALSEQIRLLDQTLLKERWLVLSLQREEARDEQAAAEDERSRLDAAYDSLSAEIETLRLERDEADRLLRIKQEEDYNLRSTVKDLEGRIEFNAQSRERLAETGRQLQEELESGERDHESIRVHWEELEQMASQAEEARQAAESESGRLRAAMESARQAHQEKSGQLERLREAQVALDRRIDKIRAGVEAARAQITQAQSELLQIEGQQEEAAREFGDKTGYKADVEAELTGLSERTARLGADREQIEKDLRDHEAGFEAARAEFQKAGERAADVRSRAEALRGLIESYEGIGQGARQLIQSGDAEPAWGRLEGLVADLFHPAPELEAALAAALGDRMEALVAGSTESGVIALRHLHQTQGGRATLVPAAPLAEGGIAPPSDTSLQRLSDLIPVREGREAIRDALIGNAWLAPDLDSALAAHAAGTRLRMVTPGGDRIDPDGTVHGGGLASAAQIRFEKQRELRDLEAQASRAAAERERCEAVLLEQREAIESARSRLHQAREDLHQHEVRRAETQKDLSALMEDLRRYEDSLARLSQARTQAAARRAQAEGSVESLLAEERDVVREMESLNVRLTNAASELNAAAHALEEARGRHTESSIELTRRGEQLSSLRSQAQSFHERFYQIGQTLERRRRQIAEGEARIAELEAQRVQLSTQLTEMAAKVEEFQTGLTQARDRHTEVTGRLREIENDFREAGRQRESVAEIMHRVDLRLQQMDMELETAVARALSDHGADIAALEFDPEAVAEYMPMDYEARESSKREMEARREKIGPVNLMAIEEFQELEQRHEFLTTQQADLNASIEAIKQAITKINRTYNERFREAFEAVNSRFTEVFPRLFRGGEARLELTNPDDLQETGVDIIVHPPGKKTQRVSLLSGGEKAMTAISLLFAIFLYKPSPFCLLDEVDAPLDDANIDRFNGIVREMSNYAQFVLITHNKRTMEIADALFGITMEEKGVSKNVSVELN